MKQIIRKMVDILVYRHDVSETDKSDLIRLAGEEGLFLGQEKIPTFEKCDDSPQKTYSIPYSGIKVETWDDKDFYFYTDVQGEVENIMHLMGYDSHGVWYSLFAHREEPATPDKYNRESSKEVPDEKS